MGRGGWFRGGFRVMLAGSLAAQAAGCSRPAVDAPARHDIPSARGVAPWFRNVAAERGLDIVNDPGPPGSFFMPQSMGNGAALFDADGDGRLDVFLADAGAMGSRGGKGPAPRLFLQGADGRFRNATAGSGLEGGGFGCGVAVGDADNDGRPDLVVTEYGGLRLLRSAGVGRFTDVTAGSGLAGTGWGASAAFFDFDRDGRLDLFVANYVAYDPANVCYHGDGARDYCGPKEFSRVPASLYRNVTEAAADGPRFVDVSASAGLAAAAAAGLGVLCADFDGDGWDDVFVANDQDPNHLWINRRDGTFREEGVIRGVATNVVGATAANMGISRGDMDGDGLDDLFVTHLDIETHTLWRQGPRGTFADATAAAGLTRARRNTGFGTVLADFDLDGDLDLAFVNGRIGRGPPADAPALDPFWRSYAQPNDLFENDGRGVFTGIAAANPALCGTPNVARALCAGDIDDDGDVDLLVATTAGRPLLLENVAVRRGHWLLVRALEPTGPRDAHGAVVTVAAATGSRSRLVQPGSGYFSSHDPRVHFGLGAAAYDSIIVRWTDGTTERFPGGPADRRVDVVRGTGAPP
jgi:enediyne biosynthesis protein E4